MILEEALTTGFPGPKYDARSERLENLRRQINDENYLNAAIQRIALILSNELMGISKEGMRHERKRRQ